MSFFNQDEDETVRQTLERVMREKGMWKEPKTMHTEIGDFSYYDDDDGSGNANGNASTNAANNQSAGGTRDYTVNTKSLIGKPSSYFQNNNNAGSWGSNNTRGFGNNTTGWSGNNGDFGANPSFATTPTLQNQTSTPRNNPAAQINLVPWRNNQTLTPWAGGYDLSTPTQSNKKSIDYSLYGDGFSKEFIDQMLNDSEFQNILNEYIIPNEGGYNNDPADTGGETNMGIAKKAHKNEDVLNMTRERANAIYYKDYYNWNGLNKIPYPIRGFVVDYGLPTNPLNAIQTVHKVLNLPPNGTIIGKDTLGVFENYNEEDYNNFLEKYRTEMKNHFREIARRNPQKQKFLNGWLNRADKAHLAK